MVVNTHCEDPDDPAGVWATVEGDSFVDILLTVELGKGGGKPGPEENRQSAYKEGLKTFTKKGWCGANGRCFDSELLAGMP